MTSLTINPWIGDKYGTSTLFPGSRILILGESFYGKPQEDKPEEMTEWLTLKYLNNEFVKKRRRKFWLNTNNLFKNKRGGSIARNQAKEFWNSVAFSNYIRHAVLPKSRARVPDEFWEIAKEKFPALLDDIKPTFIAVMGFRVWHHLPKSDEQGCGIPVAPKSSRQTRIFHYPDGKALAFRVKHPSGRGFKYANWYPSLMQAIDKSNKL